MKNSTVQTVSSEFDLANREPAWRASKTLATPILVMFSLLILAVFGVGACAPKGEPPGSATGDVPATPDAAVASSALLDPVEGLMAAFNEHDVQAMTQFVHDDLIWSSVTAKTLAIEAQGREALEAGMTDYFASLPSVRSEIEDVHVSGSFVTVGERVHWDVEDPSGSGSNEARTQRALAVYHVTEGLIQSVWYFQAEP